ncbi:MAG TPA: gamma-glutamylcyclotransferase family protein [Pyrinomonadaceae bacterium]|nr:gamma-glutamylcyclotransferase family protein [Pyrinomonadaceae bacterium]
MADARTWIFFYGTFMDPAILRSQGIDCDEVIPARVTGYELRLRPRGNLVASERGVVYGSIAKISHDEIAKLYRNLDERFGLKYLPEAVLAETLDGALRPALCYIVPNMKDGAAEPQYIDQMIAAVKAIGLPDWYADQVKSLG